MSHNNRSRFQRTATAKLGDHRGRPRVYLQGLYLLHAGFEPGLRIHATFGRKRVTLHLDEAGERRVSAKRAGRVPVIDLNTAQLRKALGQAETLTIRVSDAKIIIEPSRTARKLATRCKNGKSGTLFSGGGTMSAAARNDATSTAPASAILQSTLHWSLPTGLTSVAASAYITSRRVMDNSDELVEIVTELQPAMLCVKG